MLNMYLPVRLNKPATGTRMKKISVCIFVCALIFTGYAHASWIDLSGTPIADAPNRKSIGNLGAWLVLTDKEQETFAHWNTPSEGVNIHSTA